MIEVNNVYKSYGVKTVLNGVNFKVGKGEILGIIGGNGAGKTTLLNILAGHVRSDVGEIKITNCDLRELKKVANLIGYVADSSVAYPYMTAYEYLSYLCACANLNEKDANERIETLFKMFGLKNDKTRIVSYSKGEKQRLSVAAALLSNPQILIMDEPTNSLDIVAKKELKEIFLRLKKSGKTVIFTTHIVNDLPSFCDKVAVLEGGRITVLEYVSDILAQENSRYIMAFSNVEEAESFTNAICENDNVVNAKTVFSKVLIITKNIDCIEMQLLNAAKSLGLSITAFSKAEVSFEEAFIRRLKNERA